MTTAKPTGTIDITNLVNSLQADFDSYGSDFLFTELCAIPYAGVFFALPIVSTLAKVAIKWAVTKLAGSVVLAAFFLNTAVRKASQAQDYISAVTTTQSLPTTATQQEVANAEAAQMLAFRNFVMVTN